MEVTEEYLRWGKDYFDNPDFPVGYGRYTYDGRYAETVKSISEYYHLHRGARVLEIGCAKGFTLVEFFKQGMTVDGIDASPYAVQDAHPDIRDRIRTGSAASLPFEDATFDFVFGKEVLPHIPRGDLEQAVRECMRVAKGPIFFEVQCGRTPKELEYMRNWDRTHQVIETPEWWNAFFADIGYTGDVHYKVLIPETDEPDPVTL